MAFVSHATGAHADTDFRVPVAGLLSDARVEGMSGNLAVWSENMTTRMQSLLAIADSIVQLTPPGTN